MIAPQRLQHLSSGGLALLMHAMLLLGLMVGVSWKNPPHLPIEADIWTELPAPPQIAPPPPEFAPQPEPLPPPNPMPAIQPVQPNQAEIALQKAEKKKLEELRREELRQAELQRKIEQEQAEAKRTEALRNAELERIEKERLEMERQEKARQEQSRRLIDQEFERQMREELDAESSQLNAMQLRAKAGRQQRVVRDFQERIRAKIRNALVLPQNLKGDAEVVFQVSLLPNGEVLRVTLLRTSGQPLYDSAVERAIFKASPLPLPKERDAAQPFREGLTLKFRPSENAAVLP